MAELNRDLTRIADMLSDVLEEALRQQDVSRQALTELKQESNEVRSVRDAARQDINEAMTVLPSRVEAAIDKRLRDAADQAANTMLSRWTLANQAAERAARLYQMSVSRLVIVVVTVFGLGVVAGAILTTVIGGRA